MIGSVTITYHYYCDSPENTALVNRQFFFIVWKQNLRHYFLIPIGFVVLNPPPLVENCETDDDSLEAVCGDDDETFSCCKDTIPGL